MNSTGLPPTKRSRSSITTRDRVVLDVGGRKFITSRSTLAAGSSYFAAQFSSEWNRHHHNNNNNDNNDTTTNDQEEEECFIDQNPEAFPVILDFLRSGMLDISDCNKNVLLLAEYLGIAKLLDAVKVQSYCNMHPNFGGTAEEAMQAFDEEFGSMGRAIHLGCLPKYLTQRKWDPALREYATLTFFPYEGTEDTIIIRSKETSPGHGEDFHFLQALNWLHYHGYTSQCKDMEVGNDWGDQIAFVREQRRPQPMDTPITDIFIHHDGDANDNNAEGDLVKKTFVLLISDRNREMIFYGVRSDDEVARQGGHDIPDFQNSRWGVGKKIAGALTTILKRGYYHREKELEEQFHAHLDFLLDKVYLPDTKVALRQIQIYSKKLELGTPAGSVADTLPLDSP